jgi:hypothetical protein
MVNFYNKKEFKPAAASTSTALPTRK